MKRQLWQLSIVIPEAAEEPIGVLLETIFGQTPSIYTDANTGKTICSVFFSDRLAWNSRNRLALVSGLKTLQQSGVNVGTARTRVHPLPPQDWAESWKKHFKPIEIAGSLLIKPSWSKMRPSVGQACVVLDPGLSFGTGQHATTSFCLRALARARRVERNQSFLDIGSGSGILAISAVKLGYSPVRAFDFDRDAVRISNGNARRNGVSRQIKFAMRDLTKIPKTSRNRYDVICANLMHDLLLSEWRRILNRLSEEGSLILAGILKTQFAEVKQVYEKAGMVLDRTKVEKEWQSGLFVYRD